jgi:hypothetical protein
MKKNNKIYARTITPGKKGTNIDKEKYQLIYDAILETLKEKGEIPFNLLSKAVKARLRESFDGSVAWYTTTVKLDMEYRGIIERISGRKPQHLRLKKK